MYAYLHCVVFHTLSCRVGASVTVMASHNVQITLKEFCPLYYLYNNIPVKVQKGFRSVQVYLTALDTSSDYIAVGSSIGMLYLYCRHLSQMNKYSLEVSNIFKLNFHDYRIFGFWLF